MKFQIEARCIVCYRIFCCADCRRNHEKCTHGINYDCCICRGQSYLCKPEELLNKDFLQHLVKEHLPMECKKCHQLFTNMDHLMNVKICESVSELIDKEEIKETKSTEDIDARFDSIYKKHNKSDAANFEAIISVNKFNKTAVITPIVRKKTIVDYDSSNSDEDTITLKEDVDITHFELPPKTPKFKKHRAATPHVKKILSLMRQKAVPGNEGENFNNNGEESPVGSKTTPNRKDEAIPDTNNQITTPIIHPDERCLKLAQLVTTSTPTHAAMGNWTMFTNGAGADSPLSEIEGTTEGSPAQSIDAEPSKAELSETVPKLKSIIVTGSRIRLGSQDSSEKQVTFQESSVANNSEPSVKAKRVKFADDTVFEQETKIKRVFRKPRRMLTPGPQKPQRNCLNPRFQALINRFENQGKTLARTPVTNREAVTETTPPVGEHTNIPARAINFKDDSPIVNTNAGKDCTELFKSCVDSPDVNPNIGLNKALSTLTNNLAGSLQSCLSSAVGANDEETEIQFKVLIKKRKVSVKQLPENDADENCDMDHESDNRKNNIWSCVARAVKNVFWSDQAISFATAVTPVARSFSDSTSSSGSKRKCDQMSDSELSPLNHKRHKYVGRIVGRPPLPRVRHCGVASLRSSRSAEQQVLKKDGSHSVVNDENLNLSF